MGIQRLNKKGMEFKSGLFSIIAVSMFIIAAGVIVGGWNDRYGVSSDESFSEYNELDEISQVANSTRIRLSPNDPDPSEDSEANTFRGVYGILTSIFSSFDIIFDEDGMLNSVTNRFGVPDYVRQGIIALVLIGITFSLVAIIFRLSRRSA